MIFMAQTLHPELSPQKRTQLINVVARVLALKTDSLSEAFKYKDVRGIACSCSPHMRVV
jgi:hypothetical protein